MEFYSNKLFENIVHYQKNNEEETIKITRNVI